MAASQSGDPKAGKQLAGVWRMLGSGDHAMRCIVAHYLDDVQGDDVPAEPEWDRRALAALARIRDEELVASGIASAAAFLPSLHLNLDSLGAGVVDGEQMLDLVRPVDPGAPWSGDDAPPARQGLDPAEDRARPTARVLAVLPAVATRGGEDGFTSVPEELVGLLVHTHHRHCRVVGASIDVEDVLHPRHELPVGLGRDGPALLQMRTQRPLFKTFPMVEWSRSGMSSITATCFSSSRSDHRA